MKQFLVCLFLFTLTKGESDFFDAQLASKTISIPYSNAALTVYQHKLDVNRYYVAPVGIFQVDTMKTEKHPLTKVYGLKFSVVLTNSHIRNTVLQYLALKLSNCASKTAVCTIELVPTDRVRLHWSTDIEINSEYSIDKVWHTNTNLQDYVDFIIGCTTEKICQQLYNDIERAPETFVKGLQLEYMTTGAEMPSRIIQVNSSYVRSHSRFTTYKQLAEQSTSVNNGQIYINNQDRNELLTSIARDSLAQQIEDEGYQPDNADSQMDLVKLLSDMLISEQITLNSHLDETWKSLYWHENNQRPDEAVKTLEKILDNLKTKNHTRFCNSTSSHTDVGSELDASLKLPKEILSLIPGVGKMMALLDANDGDRDSDETTKKKQKKKKTQVETVDNDGDDNTNDDQRHRRKRFLAGANYNNRDETDIKSNYCLADLFKMLQTNEKYVEWSGTSFRVKPMTVYRLNVGNYSDVAAMTIRKVKIKLRKNVHSVALRSSTTIIANTSSHDLIPSAFGTLWISSNLTELQSQFEEWKLRSYNELLSKYNDLSVKYDKLNESLIDSFNRTKAVIRETYNRTSSKILSLLNATNIIQSTFKKLVPRIARLENVSYSTVTRLDCWHEGELNMRYIFKHCN